MTESEFDKYIAGKSIQEVLDLPPPPAWVKENPLIMYEVELADGTKTSVPYNYLPIDKIEYLLKCLFGRHKIEVLREGVAFNGVFMTVRVHYQDSSSEWVYQDGVGAVSMRFTGNKISPGQVEPAFPLAKTLAVKNACRSIGRIFGADLNREDAMPVNVEPPPLDKQIAGCETVDQLLELAKNNPSLKTSNAYKLKYHKLNADPRISE